MMQSNRPSVWVMALGVAIVVTANVTLAVAVWWPGQLPYMPIVFVGVFGLVLSQPLEMALGAWSSLWYYLQEAESHRLARARYAHERRNVGKVKLTLTAQPLPAVDTRA